MFLILYFSFIAAAPVHLADDNFTEFINSTNLPVFLKLWASWCPHCKELEPTWNELAEINEYDGVISIADIECESNRKTCKQFEGENYPRLYWIDSVSKSPLTYHGSRTIPHFRMFIKKQLNFPLLPINDISEIENFTKTASISSVIFFKINDKDSNSLKIAKNVASQFRSSDLRFIYYGDDSIKSAEMIVYNEINRNETFSSDWNEVQLTKFILRKSVPFLAEVNSYIMNFFMVHNVSSFIRVTNISKPIDHNTFDSCEKVSSLYPVTKTDCQSSPWFCRLVDIDLNTTDVQYVIYNRYMKLFWVYREKTRDSQTVYNWASNVSLNLVKPQGPGIGLFSPFKTMYYNQKSQGNPVFVVFIPPILVLLIAIYMTYMCFNEKASLKKID